MCFEHSALSGGKAEATVLRRKGAAGLHRGQARFQGLAAAFRVNPVPSVPPHRTVRRISAPHCGTVLFALNRTAADASYFCVVCNISLQRSCFYTFIFPDEL